jgi:DNA repair protein RadC
MNEVRDGEGFYSRSTPSIRPDYRAELENCLAGVLRSTMKAAQIMRRVFGNSEIRHIGGSGHALRLWLLGENEFGLSDVQKQALRGALGLGKLVYVMQHETEAICEPQQAAAYFMNQIGWKTTEHFAVLMVNVRHQVLGFEAISVGGLSETLAHPREIFQAALRFGASRIFVGHNHPGGSTEPSPEDLMLTRQILKAAQVMGIPVLDHLIVAGTEWRSLRESTGLWAELPQE